MFAVLTSGGKQYRVEPGSELVIERVDGDAGSSITFDRVLLVGDGDDVTVGTPTIDGASVTGTVIGEALGPKLVIFKFKQKVKYRRRTGHRQHLTRVRIDEITAAGRTTKAEKAAKPAKAADEAPEAAKTDEAPATTKPKRTRAKATAAPEAAQAAAEESTATDESATTGEAPAAKPKRARKSAASPNEPAAEE